MSKVMHQMSAQAEWAGVAKGEAGCDLVSDETCGTTHETKSSGSGLLLEVLARQNLLKALKRVKANKGAAGIDGRDIDQTSDDLKCHWPLIDPTLSEHSYGFRPKRRAHDTVIAAQAFVQSDKTVVVDGDLEKFFDCVNHDILINSEHPADMNLNSSNRPVRTRMVAGVAGVQSTRLPPMPIGVSK